MSYHSELEVLYLLLDFIFCLKVQQSLISIEHNSAQSFVWGCHSYGIVKEGKIFFLKNRLLKCFQYET